jgi:UDPglucose 6-dehydrogenase
MKVGIIGHLGYVGRHMHTLFENVRPAVVCYDVMMFQGDSKEQHVRKQQEINDCDLVFVCVPTPMNPETKECDISYVKDVLSWLQVETVVLRSTVPPRTCDRLSSEYEYGELVMNPEYIGETVNHPLDDTRQRQFVILGGSRKHTIRAIEAYHMVYNARVKYRQMSALAAEITKYMENSFIGTYVTFCNEFYNICEAYGEDYHEVREAFLDDPRMPCDWTYVYKNNRGFGGKCIPKDMNAIVSACRLGTNYHPEFLDQVLQQNERIRGDHMTWSKSTSHSPPGNE